MIFDFSASFPSFPHALQHIYTLWTIYMSPLFLSFPRRCFHHFYLVTPSTLAVSATRSRGGTYLRAV